MLRSESRSPAAALRVHPTRGFSLVELLITLSVLAVVMVVLMTVIYAAQRSKTVTANRSESAQAARAILDLVSRDLRSAGYGADRDWVAAPQTPVAYVDSLQLLLNANLSPFPDVLSPLPPEPPQAYNPAGAPRPFPLNGTSWQPPIKYRTGAEVIRWTLDVNNDGAVNASDVSDPNGADAQRTHNPNDFVLVRQVYGDSTGFVPGNNGGQLQRIGLVRASGGGVPPLFTVYLKGSDNPWNWSDGPVPASRLAEIERIAISVTAPSGRPDGPGRFAETVLRTEVTSMRNVPDFGSVEYAVDGWVFNDLNKNGTRDPGEPGVADGTQRLGSYSAAADSNGYFIFRAPAGTYTLRHLAPPGYGVLTNPDSFVVTLPPAVSRSFADTAAAGGWVTVQVFEDEDADGTPNGSEPWLPNVQVTMSPGGEIKYTDAGGTAKLFAWEGAYSVTATPPDSFMVTTTNPYSGIMTNPGSATVLFGMIRVKMGTVQGMVYRDNNRNGMYDSGEPGIPNVWVGITADGGATVLGYQYTDANGNYSIDVPMNDPPGTKPYHATVIVPAGFFATSTTTVGPLLVGPGDVLGNNNFGVLGYQVIRLNASRVLSLASRDLLEKQGSDKPGVNQRLDADLVLGADAGGTDNISVWFNQYDNTPVFEADPTYTRNAPQSVLALAVDTLDSGDPKARPDVVTGTKSHASGNFFVWFNQNSGSNEGYLPVTYDPGQNYRTADNGDVQTVLTHDCVGGLGPDQPDILVGTKSPTAYQGTIEVWQNDNAVTPSFTPVEIYPPSGSIPGSLGEVTALALADLNQDGIRDLIVGTRLSGYNGQLMLLRGTGKAYLGSKFQHDVTYDIPGEVTALTVAKVDFDALPDVLVGIQTAADKGRLQYWHNEYSGGKIDLAQKEERNAPGLVLSLITAELGGLPGHDDVAMGWRADPTSYVGGLRILYLDSGSLPSGAVDPSAGSVTNMVPALTVNNFNYGVSPAPPLPPFLTDLAAGVKVSATTGAVVLFIR